MNRNQHNSESVPAVFNFILSLGFDLVCLEAVLFLLREVLQ